MKMMTLVFVFLAVAACNPEAPPPPTPVATSTATVNTSTSEGTTYPLRGTIVGRDAEKNQLTVDHEAIPNFMAAMVMPYEVRDTKVDALPADGTTITAIVHAADDTYWLSDVKSVK